MKSINLINCYNNKKIKQFNIKNTDKNKKLKEQNLIIILYQIKLIDVPYKKIRKNV